MKRYRSTDKRMKSLSDWPSMLLTFTVCLLCWGMCYRYSVGFPLERDPGTIPLWILVGRLFNHQTGACLAGMFIILLVAYLMQRISDIKMLIRERTRLPFMLFLLFISTNAGLLPVREVAFALLCLVFAIHELFYAYQSPELKGKFFNIGVLVGVAGLFMPQIVWFIPLFWIGMYQIRSLNFMSFMASIAGLFVICWFVLAWCVWKHDFLIFLSLYNGLTDFKLLPVDIYDPAKSIVVLIVLVMAFFHTKMDAFNNSVRVRQMLSFLLNMIIWTFILILLYGKDTDSFLAVIYLPSSVVMAYFLENIRRTFRFVLYYFMLLACLASFLICVWIF
jgi:hypothetical protein